MHPRGFYLQCEYRSVAKALLRSPNPGPRTDLRGIAGL